MVVDDIIKIWVFLGWLMCHVPAMRGLYMLCSRRRLRWEACSSPMVPGVGCIISLHPHSPVPSPPVPQSSSPPVLQSSSSPTLQPYSSPVLMLFPSSLFSGSSVFFPSQPQIIQISGPLFLVLHSLSGTRLAFAFVALASLANWIRPSQCI